MKEEERDSKSDISADDKSNNQKAYLFKINEIKYSYASSISPNSFIVFKSIGEIPYRSRLLYIDNIKIYYLY